MAASFRFVGYPAAVLVDDDNKPVIQRLWGSYLQLTGKKEAGFLQVKMGKDLLWIDENDTQTDGLLEIVFVDIGQGDGCLLSIPVESCAASNAMRLSRSIHHRGQKPSRLIDCDAATSHASPQPRSLRFVGEPV